MWKPRYNTHAGYWSGGDSRALYIYTSTVTGKSWVEPGAKRVLCGPQVTVRQATKHEAELYWQSPLNEGWKVLDAETV
jgi:hypothetical protein